MSSGYGANPLMQTLPMSRSGGASFGSFNVDEALNDAPADDVDDLLTALEAATSDDAFLKANDDDFVKEMLEGEAIEVDVPSFLTQRENHVLDEILAGQNSLPSLDGGLEPLGLNKTPSDPNLLDGLVHDMEFQNNSTKLDEYIHRSNLSDIFMDLGNIDKSEPERPPVFERLVEQEQTSAELYPERAQGMHQDDTSSATNTGKRRRAPRRGSLPAMHLHYENPFEPTPIPATLVPEDEPPAKLAAVPEDENEALILPAGGHRHAQRRGSLPTMHLNYSSASFMAVHDYVNSNHQEEKHRQQQEDQAVDMTTADLDENQFAPPKMKRVPRRGSTGSYMGCSMAFDPGNEEMPILGVGDVSANVRQQQEGQAMDMTPADLDENPFAPRKMGRMSRRGTTGSYFGGSVAFGTGIGEMLTLSVGDVSTAFQEEEGQAVGMTLAHLDGDHFAPRKIGRMARRGSTGSYIGGSIAFGGGNGEIATLGAGAVSATVPENLHPEKMMQRLQDLMSRSVNTQKSLQKWDKDNGLPKSHSQTMVNTSRSRKQLLTGAILPKWDGTPLISAGTELGKPRARSKVYKKEGGKMKRRMSAPASSAFF